jgi:hypothetical protein
VEPGYESWDDEPDAGADPDDDEDEYVPSSHARSSAKRAAKRVRRDSM